MGTFATQGFNEDQHRAFMAVSHNEVVVFEAERKAGKSYWLFWTMMEYLKRHEGTRGILFAANYKMVIDTFKTYCERIVGAEYLVYQSKLVLSNRSELLLVSIDNIEKYKSQQAFIVGIDNMDQLTRKDFQNAYSIHRWPNLQAKVLATQSCDPIYPKGTVIIKADDQN